MKRGYVSSFAGLTATRMPRRVAAVRAQMGIRKNGGLTMRNVRTLAIATIALAALCLVVYPVYAQVAKGAAHAKEMCKMMDENKMTLVKAITAAEEHCKGKALQAAVHQHEKALTIDVYCIEGDKIMLAKVDGKTGKVTAADKVKELGGHPEKKHEGKPKESPKKKP